MYKKSMIKVALFLLELTLINPFFFFVLLDFRREDGEAGGVFTGALDLIKAKE